MKTDDAHGSAIKKMLLAAPLARRRVSKLVDCSCLQPPHAPVMETAQALNVAVVNQSDQTEYQINGLA